MEQPSQNPTIEPWAKLPENVQKAILFLMSEVATVQSENKKLKEENEDQKKTIKYLRIMLGEQAF